MVHESFLQEKMLDDRYQKRLAVLKTIGIKYKINDIAEILLTSRSFSGKIILMCFTGNGEAV
jgi:hypothetical protein